MFRIMIMPLDETDYSFVVKHRAPPPKSWKWEIYRAGRTSPIEQSSVYFETMATASRAGKEALKQLLDKLHSERLPSPLMWSPDVVPKTAANDGRRARER
jgi:hypothetical protein